MSICVHVVARVHFRCGSTICLFMACFFFVSSNAEKPVSHSQVYGKSGKSQVVVLATLECNSTMADQYADKAFSLKASSFVES